MSSRNSRCCVYLTRRVRCLPNVLVLILVYTSIFIGCSLVEGDAKTDPPPDALVWVATDVSGGVQCISDDYHPPNVERVLEAEGIPVYETDVRRHGVCAACGCPDYAATHYAQIQRTMLDEAKHLDFRQERPPEE